MVFKLTIEPIPQCNWGISLAHILPKDIWNAFRREVYKKHDYSCEICGNTDQRLHCHEEWTYDERKKIQKLKDVHCICELCHDVKHWGKTMTEVHAGKKPQDYLTTLESHFCEVNKCSIDRALKYRVEMGTLAQYRSKRKYTVDFDRFEPGKLIKLWSKGRK